MNLYSNIKKNLNESEDNTKTFNGYLYHCSNSPIEQFDTNHFEEDSMGGVSRGFGIYFCATEEAAKSYQSKRKPYILKCKVECDNVIDYNEYKRLINQSEQENIGNNTFHAWHPETIRETMLNNNVDALIDSYDDQNILEMVVYNLDCIKNAELISQLKESNINESGPYYIGPKEYCMITKNDEDSDLLSLYLDNNKYAEEVIPKNWSEDKIRKLAGKISNSEGPRGDRDFVKEVEQESLNESEENTDNKVYYFMVGICLDKNRPNAIEDDFADWPWTKIPYKLLDENWGVDKTKEEAINWVKNYIANGVPGTFGVVFEATEPYEGFKEEIHNGNHNDMDWSDIQKGKLIYSSYKEDKSPDSIKVIVDETNNLHESENTLFCVQDITHPDFSNKGYQTTQFDDLIVFTNKEDAQKYINYLNTIDKNEYKIVDATTFDKDKMVVFNTFDDYKKSLNESDTAYNKEKTFTIKEEFNSLEKLQGAVDNPNRLTIHYTKWNKYADGIGGTNIYTYCYTADYDWTREDIKEFIGEENIKKKDYKGDSKRNNIGAGGEYYKISKLKDVSIPYNHGSDHYYLIAKKDSQLNESDTESDIIDDVKMPNDPNLAIGDKIWVITYNNKKPKLHIGEVVSMAENGRFIGYHYYYGWSSLCTTNRGFMADLYKAVDNRDLSKDYLHESDTEDYWDATELDRVGFMALLKFNNPEKHTNPSMEYIITNDNNEVYRFAMEGSTEKTKDIGAKIEFRKYLNNKEDELNIEDFDNFEIPAYHIKGVFNKDTGEVIYTVGSNSTNRNEYRKNINDLKQEEFPNTHEGIVRKYIENTILKEAEGPYNQAFKVGSKLDLLLSELNTELSKCLKDMGYDEEFKKDYTSIEAKENENNTEIYFIAELDYKEGEKIIQQLDNIISKYDEDAYFEAEDTGRWVAVINKNMNESEDGIIPQSKFKNMTDEDLDNYVKFLKEELMYHTTEKQKELQKDIEKIEQILRDRDFYIDSSNEDAYNIEIVKGWKDMTQEELDKYIEDNK